MEIVEIWQNLEKNATQIMIFLPRYTWAENNKITIYIAFYTENCFDSNILTLHSYDCMVVRMSVGLDSDHVERLYFLTLNINVTI